MPTCGATPMRRRRICQCGKERAENHEAGTSAAKAASRRYLYVVAKATTHKALRTRVEGHADSVLGAQRYQRLWNYWMAGD